MEVASTGLDEVMRDLALLHPHGVPTAAESLALQHLALNMFLVNRIGAWCFSLSFILLNMNV